MVSPCAVGGSLGVTPNRAFGGTPFLADGKVGLALARNKEQLARTVFDVKNAQTNVAHLIEKLGIREPIRWVLEKVTR